MTICTEGMRCLFGEISGETVHLSSAGRMIEHWLGELSLTFPHVELDTTIIMPNHVHLLIRLRQLPTPEGPMDMPPLGQVVGWFKSITTNAYGRGVREQGWPLYEKRFWQRGYYDRIVRNDEELCHYRGYIVRNPLRWNDRRQDGM